MSTLVLGFQITLRLLPNRPQTFRSQAQLLSRLESSPQTPHEAGWVEGRQQAAGAGTQQCYGAAEAQNLCAPALPHPHLTNKKLRPAYAACLHPPPPKTGRFSHGPVPHGSIDRTAAPNWASLGGPRRQAQACLRGPPRLGELAASVPL